MSILALLAAGLILVHSTRLIAKLNHRNWFGNKLQFAGLAAACSLMAGGAVGIAVGYAHGATMLLFGVAGLVLFDRRSRA